MNMNKVIAFTTGIALMLCQAMTPAAAGWNPDKKKPTTTEEVQETIANFLDQDSGLQKFFDNAHGYAVFPKIYKGAIGVGGAYGSGQVYEKGKFIGDSTLTQLTIGLQLGGQSYSELIFFGEKEALDRFKSEKMEFSAQMSAVAATAGASADAAYSGGVAIFTLAIGGLMYEASVGGQTFTFTPAE